LSNVSKKSSLNYTDFSGGEVAPSVRGRVDSEKYSSWAREMKNCRGTRQGSLEGRNGFKHFLDIPGDDAKIFPLEIEGFQEGVLIFRDDGNLQILGERFANQLEYLLNPTFTFDFSSWNTTGWRKTMITDEAWTPESYALTPIGTVRPADVTGIIPAPNFFVTRNDGNYIDAPLVLRSSTRDIRFESNGVDSVDDSQIELVPDHLSIVGRVSQLVSLPNDGTEVNLTIESVNTWLSPERYLRFSDESDLRKNSQRYFVVELGTTEGASDIGLIYSNSVNRSRVPADLEDIKPVDAWTRYAKNEETDEDLAYIESWITDRFQPGRNPDLENTQEELDRLEATKRLTSGRELAQSALGSTDTMVVDLRDYVGTGGGPGSTTPVWVSVRTYGDPTRRVVGPPNEVVEDPRTRDLGPNYSEVSNKRAYWDEEIGFKKISITTPLETSDSGAVVPSPYPKEALASLKFATAPENDAMYFVSEGYPPHILSYNRVTELWSFTVANPTGFPSEWGPDNYPSCVTFYQGRSWWGGVAAKPFRLWGSASNDYLNIDPPAVPASADEALSYDLATGGVIRWLASRDDLLVGTTLGELALRAEGTVLSAMNPPRVTVQSRFGAVDQQVAVVGTSVIFVDASDKKLRAIDFNKGNESWTSEEVSTYAEHLVNSPTDLYYSNNPESILWLVNSSGRLVGFTVAPETEVFGSFNYDVGAEVVSSCHTNLPGDGRIWLLVRRENALSLEVEDEALLDSTRFYLNSIDPDVTYSDFLIPPEAYKYTHALINGEPKDIEFDSESRKVLKDVPQGAQIALGYAFERAWEPLPVVTGQSRAPLLSVKQPRRGSVRVYASAPPYVNGQLPRDQLATGGDTGPILNFTGDLPLEIETKDSVIGLIRLTQPDPVPFRISGVFLEIAEDFL